MLQLAGCDPAPEGVLAHYDALPAKPKNGEASPSPLGRVSLNASISGCSVEVKLTSASMHPTEDEAFNDIAAQLEAVAKAIRARGEAAFGIPIFA